MVFWFILLAAVVRTLTDKHLHMKATSTEVSYVTATIMGYVANLNYYVSII